MGVFAGFAELEAIYESASTQVYRARRERDGLRVILKVLKGDFPQPQDVIRFKREFEITQGWSHPRLIRSHELIYVRNKPILIVEDVGGASLSQLAKQHSWSFAELVGIAVKIADGLVAVHAGKVIHKDINPSNIVYNPDTGDLKIIDFGISSRFSHEEPQLRSLDVLEGTLPYISPEQTGRMNRPLDHRTDFYSLGITLYELFTGTLPFDGNDALEIVHRHLTHWPPPADEVRAGLPHCIAEVIGKLMAKSADDRYHSAAGLKADLERCIAVLSGAATQAVFSPGQGDIPDRFALPQKRYGQAQALGQLTEAFENVSHGGRELVLVSGYSGAGKTSLVHELYNPITHQAAMMISGKFDQLQRNTPYSALIGAFKDLAKQLLTENDVRLAYWRQRLADALKDNGQIIVDAIPDMAHIMGPQPPVEALNPSEARNRFNAVFLRFIQVFCRPTHPLVIFLDDLQWADKATLSLLDALMVDEHTHHILVILAYRENEVAADHPVISQLDRIAAFGTRIQQIALKPLARPDLRQFVQDTLHCDAERAEPLAELVETKTGGNPFFVGQFLTTLYQQKLVEFGAAGGDTAPCWHWDIEAIRQAGITDNVVDLLLAKLGTLPAITQRTLRVAACIGNMFSLESLAAACDTTLPSAQANIMPAMQEGLVLPISTLQLSDPTRADSSLIYPEFKFLHDRVQQAAYAQIPETERPAMHLTIGRLLLKSAQREMRQEDLFEIVDHLNAGRALIDTDAERLTLAELNLQAARKAKAATAFTAALGYVQASFAAYPGDWDAQYTLTLDLHREGAELHYLNGDYPESERLIDQVWTHGRGTADRALAYVQLITQRTMLGLNDEAVDAAAHGLQLFDVHFPSRTDIAVALQAELDAVENGLAGRPVMALLDLPAMTDADTIVVMKLLMAVHTTIYFTGRHDLYAWTLARMTTLSMRYGNVPESAKGYASFGNSIAASLGRFTTGYEYGLLGLRLAERYRSQSLICKINLILSMFLSHWSRPVRESDAFDDEGELAGLASGEFQFVGYILFYGRTLNRFYRGENLPAITVDINSHLRFTQKAQHQLSTDCLLAARRLMAKLHDAPLNASAEDEAAFDDDAFIRDCHAHHSYSALAFFHVGESLRLYLQQDYTAALAAADAVHPLMVYVKGTLVEAAAVFYESLILAAVHTTVPDALTRLAANQALMANWAAHAPANFQHQLLLIDAERARIEGRDLDAMDGYDAAIESALEAGFQHHEALAHELAGRFWLGRRKPEFAISHLRRARGGFWAWGARAKATALEREFPQLAITTITSQSTSSLDDPLKQTVSQGPSYFAASTRAIVSNLDLASILKASQAISGEIELDNLLDRLLRVLVESAGAEYGCVMLNRQGHLMVAASITAEGGTLRRSGLQLEKTEEVPRTVVQYVVRSGESVVLADANTDPLFAIDPYIQQHSCRSLLCMPIRHGREMTGVLYLENNQMVGAFPPSRMGLLGILASQAAISVQNALLYADLVVEVAKHKQAEAELSEAEAQYRAVFENAADGIFRANPEGRLILANPALAKMLGFANPASLLEHAGLENVEPFLHDALRTALVTQFDSYGAIRNAEFQARRRDGSPLELSITGYIYRDETLSILYYEGVIHDVTARRRVAELQIAKEAAELAAKTKGEFLANMSHEIRTPMTAILGFTTLALRLDAPPKVLDYLQKISAAGQSLLTVINDILDFSKMDAGKLELEAIPFDLNDVLGRVRDLFTEQARAKGIALLIPAPTDMPAAVVGDPNRVTQILVNLVNNAIKFTAQGEVALLASVRLRSSHGVEIAFEVRDTGIGMTQAQIDRLFQAFSQADTSTTRQYGGTGLGLTISKNLAELMGGTISVASTPGAGTTFRLTAPFTVANAAAPVRSLTPGALPQGETAVSGRNRVLLVEDNSINQQVATELLLSAGYQVDVANNGVEAVQMAEAQPYNAILMDIQMPEMDGYEATQRLREGTQQPNVPIIAMTAHAIAGYREQCLARGMDDYVVKPIDPDALYRVLAHWCQNGRSKPAVAPKPVAAATPIDGIDAFAALAPLMNVDEVWKQVAQRGGLLLRLLERFIQNSQSNDDALRSALQAGDHITVKRMVHTTKGIAGTLAAADLRTAATELEAAMEEQGTDNYDAWLARYFAEGERLRGHIAGFLAGRAAN